MYYDNGAMPTPNRPQPPMPGFTPSGNAMPTGIVAGKLPPPKMPQSQYQPLTPADVNRPGVGVNPRPMYGQQMQGYGQRPMYGPQQMYGRRPLLLRNQNQMGRPQRQGIGMQGMYGTPSYGQQEQQQPMGMSWYDMQQQPSYQMPFSPSYAR